MEPDYITALPEEKSELPQWQVAMKPPSCQTTATNLPYLSPPFGCFLPTLTIGSQRCQNCALCCHHMRTQGVLQGLRIPLFKGFNYRGMLAMPRVGGFTVKPSLNQVGNDLKLYLELSVHANEKWISRCSDNHGVELYVCSHKLRRRVGSTEPLQALLDLL